MSEDIIVFVAIPYDACASEYDHDEMRAFASFTEAKQWAKTRVQKQHLDYIEQNGEEPTPIMASDFTKDNAPLLWTIGDCYHVVDVYKVWQMETIV